MEGSMGENLLEQLKETAAALPKKQAKICAYIFENPLEVSAMTAAEFAQQLGVGTATITRLVGALGFSNYQDFKRALRRMTVSSAKGSYSSYWDQRWKLLGTGKEGENHVYRSVLTQLTDLTREIDTPAYFAKLNAGVEMILAARRIGVMGLRSSRSLALTFRYSLRNTKKNITVLSEEAEYVYDDMSEMDEQDLIIVLATYPYVKRSGDVARLCNRLGIPLILIASGPEEEHPLAGMAQLTLSAGTYDSTPTYLPSLLIVDLLTKNVCRHLAEETSQKLRNLDQILLENGLTIWEHGRT